MTSGRKPRLLFLVTEDWYFMSHRLALAEAAQAAGFDVGVATRVGDHGAAISARNIRLYPLDWCRGDFSPLSLMRDIRRIAEIYRQDQPDLVHHIALKPAVLGGVAARLAGVPRVAATMAGRGLALSGHNRSARWAGALVRLVLRGTAAGRPSILIVQNGDDEAWAKQWPTVPEVALVRGSGVAIDRHQPLADPEGPFTLAQASRMLRIKGIADLVAAVRLLREKGHDIRLILAGDRDKFSRAAVPAEELAAWAQQDGITWLGHVADISAVWANSHVAVQASHGGEGVPKALLEAAAHGRALIATDVPGNREIVQHNQTGLLVPAQNPARLAEAILALAQSPSQRAAFGAAARQRVVAEFSTDAVNQQTLALYKRLMSNGVTHRTV